MPKYRRKKFKNRSLKKKVYKNYKDLKLLKNAVEHKFLDGQGTYATVDNTGEDGVCLNLVMQNDVSDAEDPDFMNRNGREIWATKIKIRGYVKNTNGTPGDGVMRIILARRKHQNTATDTLIEPVRGLIYNETAATGTVNSFMNKDTAFNWDILADTTFGYDTTQHTQIPFQMSRKLNHRAKYNIAVDGGVSNVVENAIYLFAITNETTEANAPSIEYEWRYSFMDL